MRRKIESVVRKGAGVADDDVPDDPESTRYWVNTGGTCTQTQKESQQGSMKVNLRGSSEIAGSLMGGVMPSKRPSCSALAAPGTEESLSVFQALKDAGEHHDMTQPLWDCRNHTGLDS